MKRIYVGLLALALAVSLCACNGESALSDPAPSTATAATATAETTTTAATTLSLATLVAPTSSTKPTTTISVSAQNAESFIGKMEVHLTVEATAKYAKEDLTPIELSKLFDVDIKEVKVREYLAPETKSVGNTTDRLCQYLYLTLRPMDEQRITEAAEKIRQHKDVNQAYIKSFMSTKPTDYSKITYDSQYEPGQISVTFVPVMPGVYKDSDFTPSALSKRFGIEVETVENMYSYVEYATVGNSKQKTGRYYYRVTVILRQADEDALEAAADAIRLQEGVAFATLNWCGFTD